MDTTPSTKEAVVYLAQTSQFLHLLRGLQCHTDNEDGLKVKLQDHLIYELVSTFPLFTSPERLCFQFSTLFSVG